MTDGTAIKRGPGGLFQPGTTPGPGRPVGSQNGMYRKWSEAITDMRDPALVQLQQKLMEGDWQAIVYVLDRTISKGRTFKLDGLTPGAIASKLANGEMSPAEARDIALAISKLVEIGQLEELRTKIEALEKRLGQTG